MHILESFSRKLKCYAVIHEVAAGIATEYFNESSTSGKALALVTAGPGLTNIISAMAGAHLESREVLVLGGQVKTVDLARGKLRQNGIQEIGGVELVKSITINSTCMDNIWNKQRFFQEINFISNGRQGPVFIEIPLDIQAKDVDLDDSIIHSKKVLKCISKVKLQQTVRLIREAKRPVLLIGGGVSRSVVQDVYHLFESMNIPVMTTWNGADRIDSNHSCYAGRPNNWGQRRSNIIQQQSDLLIAVGTRLGMQQTGFNWKNFMPLGKIIQVDIDQSELDKGHPRVDYKLCVDADDFIRRLLACDLGKHNEWQEFAQMVMDEITLVEDHEFDKTSSYVSPHDFIVRLSQIARAEDIVIPCSSGGAFSIMMQAFEQKYGQIIITNKGLASMGYGLSGAIGASISNPDKRVILVEGDGGFAQNLQEIGTAAINNCNLKIFIFDDNGYASIRMTQRTYFEGKYVGCDINTGLGLPNWEVLFKAWNVPVFLLDREAFDAEDYINDLDKKEVAAFIVKINPEQKYFPKISSRVLENGSMESNPLHLMTPDLSPEKIDKYLKYFN